MSSSLQAKALSSPKKMKGLVIQKNFFVQAPALRKHFDQTFKDPQRPGQNPFIWDHWHVPEQYCHLKSPAEKFFPAALYTNFVEELSVWGLRNLGCLGLSPIWLSCYVQGHYQNMHADLPHGPFAFVYSLSPKNLKFRGGETFIARDELLNYWANIQKFRGLESKELFDEIRPDFNQLLVFDPRRPHGVRPVAGVEAVTEGRLVLHGWFSRPQPTLEGYVGSDEFSEKLQNFFSTENALLAHTEELKGFISFQLHINRDGSVAKTRQLVSTLQGADETNKKKLEKALSRALSNLSFTRQRGGSLITLPLLFE